MITLAHPILVYTYIASLVTETKYYYGDHKRSEQIWRLSATSESRRDIVSPTQTCLCQRLMVYIFLVTCYI
jgi:hypothetical protein